MRRHRPHRVTFRPDLSDYDVCVMALVDRLNQNALYPMSKTDAVKLAIERACKIVIPDFEIKPRRKRYVTLDY